MKPDAPAGVSVHPATADRWSDVVALFGPRGACGGCWCMHWRLSSAEYDRSKGERNRRMMRALIEGGDTPGVLAYDGDTPVGWCAVAPREDYPRLRRSRILAPVDDRRVWSIVCLFVVASHRRRGISLALIRGAVEHARSCGADVVEAYPVEPRRGRLPDLFAFTGLASAFRAAGFREVARRSETRPVMRWTAEAPAATG